jgi:SHS2 domain-containing protein
MIPLPRTQSLDQPDPRWEHFAHEADIGVRGVGATQEEAFEQVALALAAAVCPPEQVQPREKVDIDVSAPDDEILLVDWLNALIYEMATRRLVLARFSVVIEGHRLRGRAWGESIDVVRHRPAVEPKGATFTALRVARDDVTGTWTAECVIDV